MPQFERSSFGTLFCLALGLAALLPAIAGAQTAPSQMVEEIQTPTDTGGMESESGAEEAQADVIENEGAAAAGLSPRAGRTVEEIVVSARKREELLEDTPVSVSALGQNLLRETQVQRIEEIEYLVPNLSFRNGRNGQDANVYIRGVGTQDESLFFDQGVGVYVDGVYLSRSQGSIMDIVDIAQIEVLRGPQGTLFGKNTVGGAVSITTQKPTPEPHAFAMVRAGNYNLVQTRGMINIPIIDDMLYSRFNVASTNSSGYTYNSFLDEDWGNQNNLNFYGALRFEPTDDITLDIAGSWVKSHFKPRGGDCVFQRLSNFEGIPGAPTQGYYDYCSQQEDPFTFESDVATITGIESYGAWGTLAYDIGDIDELGIEDFTLKAIGSWREQFPKYREDVDMSRYDLWRWSSTNKGGDIGETNGTPGFQQQTSFELQQNATAWDGKIQWVTGAFLYWEHANSEFDFRVFPGSGVIGAIGGASTRSIIATDNFNWALYGQATVDFTDWLSLTGGLRFTHEDKEAFRSLTNLLLCESGSPPPCTATDPPQLRAYIPGDTVSFERWTPMGTLAMRLPEEYMPDAMDHLMGYFTYSQGFKGGGINAGAQTMDPAEASEFAPEVLDSFELGIKTIGFDRRVRASLAVFYGDYTDLQLPTVQLQPCPPDEPDCINQAIVIIDNAGKARNQGVEFELQAEPVDGLQVLGSVGYLDAKFTEYQAVNIVTNDPIDRDGERLPFVPDLQTHLGMQYSMQVATEDLPPWMQGWLTPRVDWAYTAAVKNWGRELTGGTQPGYNLVNLRLGYTFNDDRSQLALWSKNVANETYFDEVYAVQAQILGTISRFYGWPRTFGVELSHNF
ncbi:MAG: TonB-dependent receptor [Candidatus Binatia bacterium]|nr:TonB-dependent receptor [Candidatus Binatia bacterium]